MKTKKVGSAGRYAQRYGTKIRAKVTAVEIKQRQKHRCPECHRFTLQRIAMGIYQCKKCENKFVGKAYTLE